jgi:hypothetical protein
MVALVYSGIKLWKADRALRKEYVDTIIEQIKSRGPINIEQIRPRQSPKDEFDVMREMVR